MTSWNIYFGYKTFWNESEFARRRFPFCDLRSINMYFVVARVSFQCHQPSFNRQFHVLFSFLLFSLVIPLLLIFFCSFSRSLLYLFSTLLVYLLRYNLSNHHQTQQVPWPLKTIQNLGTFETPFTRAKKSARHSKFLAPCFVYACRNYLLEVVSAPLKLWALVPHNIWDRYVYTSKLGVPCPKIVSTVPKIWRTVPIFLARVNGVWVAGSCATIVEDALQEIQRLKPISIVFFLFACSGMVAMF